ncbi:hypothetical protein JXE04_01465 [Patescibacteria group bacterium]|nr:hypothetical protein [Patescibacteria group bacterium]
MKRSYINSIRWVLLLALLFVLVFIFWNLLLKKSTPNNSEIIFINNNQPILMNIDEKNELGIPENMSVEILNRTQDGQITTYKLIKDN